MNYVEAMLAAPSMMSLRSCGPPQLNPDPTYQNQQQLFLSHFLHAHSQPQLSHSCSQPFLATQPTPTPGGGITPLSGVPKRVHPHGRMISSSADKLTSMSYSHIASAAQLPPPFDNSCMLLSFHEQVKNMSPFVVSKCEGMSAVTTAASVTENDVSVFTTAAYLKPQSGNTVSGPEPPRFSQVRCVRFDFYFWC